jgi:hypothetical protein
MALMKQKCQHFDFETMGGGFRCFAGSTSHSRHFLLRPLEISLRFLCGSHAFGKVRPCLGQTSSCLGLEGEELAVFGIEFAGPWK